MKAFDRRHVAVTGGTGALGTAVVGALLDAGAICHVPYIDETELQCFPYRDDQRVRLVGGCDLSDEAAVAALYDGIPALWASIHLAGGFAMAPVAHAGKDALLHMLNMNLVTTYLCSRAAVRSMQAGAGRIVNVAARCAIDPFAGAGMTAYAASKAAVAALTQGLARELADTGILVNAIAPTMIDTPANRAAMPGADRSGWSAVEDIAATVCYLASPENRVTRGAVMPV
jgi:NAD(P)-dependent dehydrogenase (short-subunit alcohol dehydrogenase family)